MAPSSGGGPAAAAVNNSGSNISVAGSASASASHTRQHSSSLAPSLGEASGVAILLGNHAKFGLAERCCYHFDLIETLTSIPTGRMQQQQARARRRDRGLSVSSQEGAAASNKESGSSGGGSVQGNRDREASSASNANDKNAKPSSKNIDTTAAICGVVSLLECVSGGGVQADRTLKRSLRSKHREFNTRAQVAWGRSTRGTSSGALKRKSKVGSSAAGGGGTGTTRRCHQPRHLPLPLNTNTRVTFAYELTSIAIILDASPSLTSTFGVQSMMCDFGPFGEEKLNTPHMNDSCCVPLDSLGSLMKKYLQGLVQPIEVPPVAVSGLGVAFGRWKPNLAITVVAAYPPTSKGDRASAGLLVRDFRVTDDASALELASQIERWALREVESVIAERLSGERDFSGDGVGGRDSHQHTPILSPLGTFALPSTQNMGSWTQVKTSMKDLLAVGDAALSTLPPEGRPVLLVATDCRNVHCGGTFESLSDTSRCDVLLSVLSLSLSPKQGSPDVGRQESIQPQEIEHFGMEFSPSPLYVSDDSQPLRDMAHLSGGIFLDSSLLESYVNSTVGSPLTPSCLPQGDYHFSYKKRSIKPNGLQWYSLFTMSPFTPAMSSAGGLPSSLRPTSTLLGPFYRSSSIQSLSGSVSSAKQILGKPSELLNPALASSLYDSRTKVHGASYEERIAFAKYNISPVRIKSLLMTRVVEGYRARRYGHNTQDNDKVSVHLVLRLADCGIVLHYEASFVSSPYHIPTVGQAHVKIELSGNDPDFIQAVKKMFVSNHGSDSMIHGRRISPSSKLAAERICKFLRWTRKEDYLESYLCLPGWGEVNHFAPGSGFLGRLATLSKLQRYRHFRSETFEILTISPNYYEKTASIFSDVMEQNKGEDEMYSVLENWSNGLILNNRTLYFKEIIPPQEDDLAYYCIIRVLQSSTVSRLFTLTIDFHGELNAEQRLAVLSSLKESLRDSPDIVVLEKCISSYVAIRPSSPSHQWLPSWNEYFTHHKSWELLKDDEVLPLITKRRAGIGNFLLLQSDVHRGVFAKFVTSNEEGLSAPNVDVVIYQALSRADGIFVDIHMEACSSKFYPFHTRHSSTPFSRICENVRKRDKDCAKNIRSRTNLLTALDQAHSGSDSAIYHPNGTKQVEDVLRLMKLSRMYKKKLRFFNSSGSGTANDLLCRLTTDYITSDSFQTQCAKLSIDRNMPILRHSGSWFIMRVDWYVLSLACLELRDQVVQCEEGSLDSFRHLSFFTAGITDLYQSDDDVDDDKSLGDHSDAGSEHFGVSEIASDIESAHGKHFSRACYEALRSNDIISLENSEVTYALSSCRFLQIQWQTYVSVDDLSAHLASNAPTMTGTRLGAVIGNLVRTVLGSNDQVFFYHGAEVVFSNELIFRHPSSSAEHMQHYPIENDDVNDIEEETNINGQESDIPPPPLFFRFTLDRKLVSLTDILALKKSATLAAEVSVFKTTVPCSFEGHEAPLQIYGSIGH